MPPTRISPTASFSVTFRSSHAAQPNAIHAPPTGASGWSRSAGGADWYHGSNGGAYRPPQITDTGYKPPAAYTLSDMAADAVPRFSTSSGGRVNASFEKTDGSAANSVRRPS